jgi:hypothetical protein
MGRAERRAQAKGQRREDSKRRAAQELKTLQKMQQAREEEMREIITVIVLYVLHDKFGFGRKRLERFSDEVMELTDSIAKGYLDLDDMVDVLVHEAKLKSLVVSEDDTKKKEAKK